MYIYSCIGCVLVCLLVFCICPVDCSQRCFKLYSPGGPRHGAVLWFKQHESRDEWLSLLKKVCFVCVHLPM